MNATHLPFPCVPVTQGPEVTFYVGALAFRDVWPLCTVSPRKPRTDDPLYSDACEQDAQTAQREINKERVDKIADFVERLLEPHAESPKEAIFPGTVILGLLSDAEGFPAAGELPSPTAALVKNEAGSAAEVWLPKMAGSLFIIDGQHRLRGLARLAERLDQELKSSESAKPTPTNTQTKGRERLLRVQEQLMDLRVPITLFLDFDLSEQAVVFATVNFNQKPVPRSLYYDIFGAFETDRVTPIGFCHELVLHLNNSNKSPLQGMIKLLGTGSGLVTQAFLGARLSLLVDPAFPKSALRQYLIRRQTEDKTASRDLAAIIRSYFGAIRSELDYAWPKPHEGKFSAYHYPFILCKSMAMSGLIAILGDVYRLLLLDFALGREVEVVHTGLLHERFFAAFFSHVDPDGRVDANKSAFARRQKWSIGGSAVIERLIYEQFRSWVFTAYLDQIQDPQSGYCQLVTRFHGEHRAMDVAMGDPPIDAGAFWLKTETLWFGLSNTPLA